VIVRDLSHAGGRSVQRGHITRDIVFSKDDRQMFVSVGSASNDGEGIGKRDATAIARWEAEHGLGSAWGNETDRAAVLVFDPAGRNRRVFASGLRNCVGLAVHPLKGDLWCSTNERDDHSNGKRGESHGDQNSGCGMARQSRAGKRTHAAQSNQRGSDGAARPRGKRRRDRSSRRSGRSALSGEPIWSEPSQLPR
jgi:hypothetical protein